MIILVIILFSTLLGFWQERTAGNAVARLLELIHITCTVIRDKEKKEIPIEEVVPGDIINLSAGDVIPADSLIISEDELFIDEASFTGETFPVEKQAGVLPEQTPLGKRTNSLFMGSHVVSGTGTALVMATGMNTEFGHISQSITRKAPLTDFERGVKRFGYLLMEITLVMVILIFGINVMLHKPILDSLLFTLAIAVGLTPSYFL
ncbi:MAG: HAD-IC family P-type ATPase [Tannerellaceae bacterium]|nr:HAD-IC family P-type ATPase [Tannerellaceae bacterium]